MNNNMIKVLAVVVIAGGLWWWMSSGDGDAAVDACAAHADSTACLAAEGCDWAADTSEGAADGAGSCATKADDPAPAE